MGLKLIADEKTILFMGEESKTLLKQGPKSRLCKYEETLAFPNSQVQGD